MRFPKTLTSSHGHSGRLRCGGAGCQLTLRARRSAMRSARVRRRSRRALPLRRYPRGAACLATSRSTSSRGLCWKTLAKHWPWSQPSPGRGATASRSLARPATPAPCRWRCRRDALAAAAAEMVLAVEAIARAGFASLVATVGEIAAHPGAVNVMAGGRHVQRRYPRCANDAARWRGRRWRQMRGASPAIAETQRSGSPSPIETGPRQTGDRPPHHGSGRRSPRASPTRPARHPRRDDVRRGPRRPGNGAAY